MVRRAASPRKPLSRSELTFWQDAFLVAWGAALRNDGDTIERSISGLTRAASQAAWSAIDEQRRAVRGERP